MWRRAWRWLVLHLRTIEEDRERWMKQVSDFERPGPSPMTTKARCPFHDDHSLTTQTLWYAAVEGDLIECSRDSEHIWVRDPVARDQDREENGGML